MLFCLQILKLQLLGPKAGAVEAAVPNPKAFEADEVGCVPNKPEPKEPVAGGCCCC